MTKEELDLLGKIFSQIVDYSALGFNKYGMRVGVEGQALGDTLENSVSNRNITTLSCDKLLAGTITVAVEVGNGNVGIDGGNKRILVNDGDNDRVLIGYLSGKF